MSPDWTLLGRLFAAPVATRIGRPPSERHVCARANERIRCPFPMRALASARRISSRSYAVGITNFVYRENNIIDIGICHSRPEWQSNETLIGLLCDRPL